MISFILWLASLVSPIQPIDTNCILEEHIIEPILEWKPLDEELQLTPSAGYFVVKAHNYLDKPDTDQVDVKLIFHIDMGAPQKSDKYELVSIQFFNPTSVVLFSRSVSIHKVKFHNHLIDFPIQNECFSRTIIRLPNQKEN